MRVKLITLVASLLQSPWQPGLMTELRDYDAWHEHYDDPASGMSWRLGRVRVHLSVVLDKRPGPVGNIGDEDLWRTIDAALQLCAPSATLLWSRGRDEGDLTTAGG